MNPIKLSIKTEAVSLLIIFLTIYVSFHFYSNWPDRVASHWNFKGEVDGYTYKESMVWIFPLMMSIIYALFLALPYLDPKKNNYESFSGFYHFFKTTILAVLFLIYLALGVYNLGHDINITFVSILLVGFLIIIIGYFLKNIKPN